MSDKSVNGEGQVGGLLCLLCFKHFQRNKFLDVSLKLPPFIFITKLFSVFHNSFLHVIFQKTSVLAVLTCLLQELRKKVKMPD